MKLQQQSIPFLPPPDPPKLTEDAHAELVDLLATFLLLLLDPSHTPEEAHDPAS